MRSSHPAVREARKALEQELDALAGRINVRRAVKPQHQTGETEQERAKSALLLNASEQRKAKGRVEHSHKSVTPPERPEKNVAGYDSLGRRRQRARQRILDVAGRIVRWLRSAFRT